MVALDLSLGDRVSRKAKDWFKDPTLPDRQGTVTRVYHPSPQRGVVREDWILYDVRWDDTGETTSGHLREGLNGPV